jgi:Protein of unknown function (DUF760)
MLYTVQSRAHWSCANVAVCTRCLISCMADVAGIFLVMCVWLCRVQEAVKTTVLGLLGSLPRQAFETATLTTGDALANLMFQLQMTGYMFKNAEYRMSLQNSLRSGASEVPKGLITGMLLMYICFYTCMCTITECTRLKAGAYTSVL